MKEKEAAAWFLEGTRNLKMGQADAAVAAFRKAAVNDRASQIYLLSLVKALEAAQRDTEARELLLQIRESIPENPEINLELARISARQKDTAEALRYYHNALYSIWTGDDIDKQRQDIQRELIEFLIAQNAGQQALSETIALAAHVPNTTPDHLQMADLFYRIDDFDSAFEHYKWVIRREPRNQAALLGAGQAAFKLGNYSESRRLLGAVGQRNNNAEEMLEIARLVLDNDPLGSRLREAERLRRVGRDLKDVTKRVEACTLQQNTGTAPTQQLQNVIGQLKTQRQALAAAAKNPDPNIVFSSLDRIYEAETALSSSCGPLTVPDKALLLIALKSRGMEP